MKKQRVITEEKVQGDIMKMKEGKKQTGEVRGKRKCSRQRITLVHGYLVITLEQTLCELPSMQYLS